MRSSPGPATRLTRTPFRGGALLPRRQTESGHGQPIGCWERLGPARKREMLRVLHALDCVPAAACTGDAYERAKRVHGTIASRSKRKRKDRETPRDPPALRILGKVTSADGTAIAFERFGEGRPLVVVRARTCDRAIMRPLAARLGPELSVINYDRRAVREGDDGADPDREIEDLDALISTVGGAASVYGHAAGAAIALRAAARGLPITKLVLHDPVDDPERGDTVPTEVAGRVAPDALVVVGDASPALDAGKQLAAAMPAGRERVLEGSDHIADPAVLAPVPAEFLA